MTNITAIINKHREGNLAAASIKSLVRAVMHARKNELTVEIIAALDDPDEPTHHVAQSIKEIGGRVLTLNNRDLGRSRNDAVNAAQGEWVAFLDGDDLWGADWLSQAHRASNFDPRLIVWHPELCLYFGVEPRLHVHMDMESPSFDLLALAVQNYWTALSFSPRSLLQNLPFPMTNHEKHIGYEDWGWNMAVINQGGLHKVVPGTGHAIRSRTASLAKQSAKATAYPDTGDLFLNRLGRQDRSNVFEQARF